MTIKGRTVSLGVACGFLGASQWQLVHGETVIAGAVLLGGIVCLAGGFRHREELYGRA